MLSVGIIALNLERNDIMNTMSLAYGALVTGYPSAIFSCLASKYLSTKLSSYKS